MIRNDIGIKSRNIRKRQQRESYGDISKYFVGNKFVYNPDEDYQDECDDYEQVNFSKSKFEKKYDYMYDSKKYDVLLHRGLEYVDDSELQQMLGNETEVIKKRMLKK